MKTPHNLDVIDRQAKRLHGRRRPIDWSQTTIGILAGGLGTRLASEVPDRPKALAPVHGQPFIAFVLDALAAAGARQIHLLLGYRAQQISQSLGARLGRAELRYIVEDEPLGTAGSVRLLTQNVPSSRYLVLNGDSYCEIDWSEMVAGDPTGQARMAACHVPDAGRFGQVRIDAADAVCEFEEKGRSASPGWINAGAYLIPAPLTADLPVVGSMERECFPRWAAAGRMRAVRAFGAFIDIGTPQSYRQAEAFFSRPPRFVHQRDEAPTP